MTELKFVLGAFACFGVYWLWRYFRGQTVGSVQALVEQGTVPGARMRLVVKRHADAGGHAPYAEFQFRFLAAAKVMDLQAADASRLAGALDEATAWAREAP